MYGLSIPLKMFTSIEMAPLFAKNRFLEEVKEVCLLSFFLENKSLEWSLEVEAGTSPRDDSTPYFDIYNVLPLNRS